MDNIGFCYAWRKQHSRDLNIYTRTKAMRDIEQMMEIKIEEAVSCIGLRESNFGRMEIMLQI